MSEAPSGWEKSRRASPDKSAAVKFGSQFTHQEMVAENFSLDDVLSGLTSGELLKIIRNINAALAVCLAGSPWTGGGFILFDTGLPVLIVITVYEPRPPKWLTPTQRNH